MGTCDKICPPLPSLIHHYPVACLWPTPAQVLFSAVTCASQTRGLHVLNTIFMGSMKISTFRNIGLPMQTE